MRSLPTSPTPSRARRRLWLAALAAGMSVALSACASSGPTEAPAPEVAAMETGPIEITVFWWGGDARAKLTHDVLALYTKKHPNVTFKETWQANAGYIDKLNTNLAAGAAADIFQLDDNMLGGVAARNQTLDLTNYLLAKRVDTSKLSASLVDYGKVDGKQVALPLGETTPGMVYNKSLVSAPRRRRAADRLELGEVDQLGDRRKPEDQLHRVRHDGPIGRLQGAVGLATPAGQGSVQRQQARIHRGRPDQVVPDVGRRPRGQGGATGRHHSRRQRRQCDLAARGDRQGSDVVHVVQPDAGVGQEHQGHPRRRLLPGRPEGPMGARLDVLRRLREHQVPGERR